MKKSIVLITTLIFISLSTTLKAADTLFVKETQIPILIEREDNVLFYIRLETNKSQKLDDITLKFGDEVDLTTIQAVKLYYSGTEASQDINKKRFSPTNYLSSHAIGKTRAAINSYSILKTQIDSPKKTLLLKANQTLFPNVNYFWISLQMKSTTSLTTKITAQITAAKVDGKQVTMDIVSAKNINHRMGIGVRHAGDDNSSAYRIPGLVTTNKGTLLGVYDVRYNTSVDLQEMIDVGVSRSTNKGATWEPMRIAMTFGETGGLPHAQNGVGDPAILFDDKTNTTWIVAAWTHGMGNQRAWWSSHQGVTKKTTAQLVLSKSEDDGKTWSAPKNITSQVKDPSWYFLLQGPGSGITMQDGTLVFAIQFIDSTRVPNAGIMYSKDSGETWHINNLARTNTTEAQVIEVRPGILMLNMRDNRGGSRAILTTNDLGITWSEHPTNRSALQESVCMASIIKVEAKDNVTGKKLILFSNPNTTKGRNNTTIKASIDEGNTWPNEYQVMIDEDENWGYSCLSMIDAETVGILYESSTAHMVFQAIPLKDIVNN